VDNFWTLKNKSTLFKIWFIERQRENSSPEFDVSKKSECEKGLLRLPHGQLRRKIGKPPNLSAIAFVLFRGEAFSAPSLKFYSPQKKGGKLGLFSFS
jgi:hypothetical protein